LRAKQNKNKIRNILALFKWRPEKVVGAMVYYVLIQGPSYRDLDFEAREQVREKLRENLEAQGVRFVQYDWVWDEEDRCLLLVGQYEKAEDARYWIDALQSMGFTVFVRTQLPGEETSGLQ